MAGADLTGAVMTHSGPNLAGLLHVSDISGADLTGADLSGVDFSGARMYGARQQSWTRWSPGVDPAVGGVVSRALSDADAVCDLSSFDGCETAVLNHVDLTARNLEFANLSRANLAGANLASADLTRARMASALSLIHI